MRVEDAKSSVLKVILVRDVEGAVVELVVSTGIASEDPDGLARGRGRGRGLAGADMILCSANVKSLVFVANFCYTHGSTKEC